MKKNNRTAKFNLARVLRLAPGPRLELPADRWLDFDRAVEEMKMEPRDRFCCDDGRVLSIHSLSDGLACVDKTFFATYNMADPIAFSSASTRIPPVVRYGLEDDNGRMVELWCLLEGIFTELGYLCRDDGSRKAFLADYPDFPYGDGEFIQRDRDGHHPDLHTVLIATYAVRRLGVIC